MAEISAGQLEDGDTTAFRQKEEFLAIMSHEIFTPMNELVSRAGLLLDGPLSSEQKGHVKTIQKSAQDLLALLKDMHEFMAGRAAPARTEGLL